MGDAIRTAIVSGGTKGLGRACSLALGRRGYRVLALYAHDEPAAAELTADFRRSGIDGQCLKLDITRDDFELPPLEVGPLVLVNNACAPFEPKPFHAVAWSEIESQWQVAAKGSFLLTNAVLRRMVRERQGTIVNILSSALAGPEKGFSSYVITKSALAGMTRSLAAEYRGKGLRIFSLSPGFMLTSLTRAWDARLRDTISPPGTRALSPDAVAEFLLEKVENPDTPGNGEDYVVDSSH